MPVDPPVTGRSAHSTFLPLVKTASSPDISIMFPFSWSLRDWFRSFVVLSVGVLLGMAIWWTAPILSGQVEPWDAEGKYYLQALFVAGFLAAAFSPRAFWVAPIGIYIGQLLYCLYLYEPEGTTYWPLSMVLAVFYCVAALVGALAGAISMSLLKMGVKTIRCFVPRSVK